MNTDALNMRRGLALAAAATLASGFALVGPMAGISHASGCVSLVSSDYNSNPNRFVVKNNCGRTVSARVDLEAARDTPCANIAAYGTRTYTAYFGTARDAVEC